MTDAIVFISKKDLLEIMKLAFDEGWNGYRDLRESAVQKIVEDFLETRQKKSKIPAMVKLEPISPEGGTLLPENTSYNWITAGSGQNYTIITSDHSVLNSSQTTISPNTLTIDISSQENTAGNN